MREKPTYSELEADVEYLRRKLSQADSEWNDRLRRAHQNFHDQTEALRRMNEHLLNRLVRQEGLRVPDLFLLDRL